MTKKLLVIDDEKSIRKSFMLTFEDTEYSINTASNGEEGVEKIRMENYDLVFLDLKMPKMNGIEVLEKIKQLRKNVIVYIITAFHQEFFTQLDEARKKGYSFEILRKPLNSQQLKNIVDCILN